MPVPTAVQAEVLAGNADPLEVLRSGEHLLDQLAVLILDPLPLDQSAAGFGHTIGEPVPDHLQLAEVEHPRGSGSGLDAVRNLRVTKPLADEAGELSLEPGDLPAQLQTRPALVDRDIQPVEIPLSQ